MTHRSHTFTVLMLGLSLGATVVAQEPPDSEIQLEVRAAWDAYIETFSAGDTEALAQEVYAAPSYQIGSGGANLRATAADTRAAFDRTHEMLAGERYDRSETDRAEICVLNASAALLTAHFTRYRTDDSVISTGASAYLFGRVDGDWRILAILGNRDGKLVGCEGATP